MFGGLGTGVWWYSSKKDPRWDVSGTVDIMSVFSDPPEAKEALERKKKELGEPPDDLEYGCMKD